MGDKTKNKNNPCIFNSYENKKIIETIIYNLDNPVQTRSRGNAVIKRESNERRIN
jgi:hypothetical protein